MKSSFVTIKSTLYHQSKEAPVIKGLKPLLFPTCTTPSLITLNKARLTPVRHALLVPFFFFFFLAFCFRSSIRFDNAPGSRDCNATAERQWEQN
ncbi:hypothetical protein BDV23DRAFT_22528 [Aspergillus alliaceus]|uniref:Transmembrane protein n=1 Tax=Petromyces alliaceus TaxID=209559 RepID=A0A5N7CID2_PETAA|nr:hypothetical protein BDV23DRAFT_22528 [Aspergillus alliaceus]